MVCHLLDKHNMDINRKNDELRHFYHESQDDGSPLCSAILHKNLVVVQELLKRGAGVNSPHRFPVSYAVREGGFPPALEPLLRAGADATRALEISVIEKNIEAAKACLRFGADPAPALREASEQEEYRANTIAENAAFRESQPGSNCKKSERQIEKERAEERESRAMIALLRSVMG
jgi:ankyrin repeat protein